MNGKRYAVSSIPGMQKMLNKDYEKQKRALKSILSPTNFAHIYGFIVEIINLYYYYYYYYSHPHLTFNCTQAWQKWATDFLIAAVTLCNMILWFIR